MHMKTSSLSEFFEIRVLIDQLTDGCWVGRIRSVRKDTGEEWYSGKTIIEKDRDCLLKKVDEARKDVASSLEIPSDWGDSSRKILVDFRRLSEKITNFSIFLDKSTIDIQSRSDMKNEFFSLYNEAVDDIIKLIRAINELPDFNRHSLLLSRSETFDDPFNPWNLDDITGREEIFKFFINPSEEERKIHLKQLEQMERSFNITDDVI